MRVLILHNAYQQRGGEDAVVDAEAALLSGAGHDVHKLVVSNDTLNTAIQRAPALHRREQRWHQ
jgi:hypothetical protein